MMVVDACYGTEDTAPHWCSSNTASGTDDFGCEKHFDIDTDPTLGNVPAVGMDGTTWTSEFVFFFSIVPFFPGVESQPPLPHQVT